MWIQKKILDRSTRRVGVAPLSVVRGRSLQDKGGSGAKGRNIQTAEENKNSRAISAEGVHVHC